MTGKDAGLTTEEREIVANAFDRGTIKVIVATCSLAAGVNLPARRVILQGAVMGRDLVGPSMLYVLVSLVRGVALAAMPAHADGGGADDR